jgi:hypothetical protein
MPKTQNVQLEFCSSPAPLKVIAIELQVSATRGVPNLELIYPESDRPSSSVTSAELLLDEKLLFWTGYDIFKSTIIVCY